MNPQDVIACKVLGGVVYVGLGAIAGAIYDNALPGKVPVSERMAVGSIWPLMVALTVAVGFGRLLLRMIAIPRKIQNTVNQARIEARGVSVVHVPEDGGFSVAWNGKRVYDVEPIERG